MAEGGTSSYCRKSCMEESVFEQRFRRHLDPDKISQGSCGGVGKREVIGDWNSKERSGLGMNLGLSQYVDTRLRG